MDSVEGDLLTHRLRVAQKSAELVTLAKQVPGRGVVTSPLGHTLIFTTLAFQYIPLDKRSSNMIDCSAPKKQYPSPELALLDYPVVAAMYPFSCR